MNNDLTRWEIKHGLRITDRGSSVIAILLALALLVAMILVGKIY